MGSYSITIKFHSKIPIHLTWTLLGKKKEETTEFSPYKCRFHCCSYNKLPMHPSSKILKAQFSPLVLQLSGTDISSCTYKGEEKEAEWKEKEFPISPQSAKVLWVISHVPPVSIHLEIQHSWASFLTMQFLVLFGLSKRSKGNSWGRMGMGMHSFQHPCF